MPFETVKIDGVGLQWRHRRKRPEAYWVAERGAVAQGFPIKTRRMWPPSEGRHAALPNVVEQAAIREACIRLQAEQEIWKRDRTRPAEKRERASVYDGTVASLSRCYQLDPLCGYATLRHRSRIYYDRFLDFIERSVGARVLRAVRSRDLNIWFDEWAKDRDGSKHLPRARAAMQIFRVLLSYGITELEDDDCARLAAILREKKKHGGRKARHQIITYEQVNLIRAEAHRRGRPDIALAQSLQWELMLRPKDVVGEWIPVDSPGASSVVDGRQKWVVGLRWEEITPQLVLTHTLSKSLRGKDALVEPTDAAKTRTWELKHYEMLMEELAFVQPKDRVGPVIVDVLTGLPFKDSVYLKRWKEIARAVGVPTNVQNRDTRAGAITDAFEAGAPADSVRQAAAHSDIRTTMLYARNADARTDNVAILRTRNRAGGKP